MQEEKKFLTEYHEYPQKEKRSYYIHEVRTEHYSFKHAKKHTWGKKGALRNQKYNSRNKKLGRRNLPGSKKKYGK